MQPFALVVWNDAHADFDTVSVNDAHQHHKPTVMHTTGWILKEDEAGVSIAAEFCPSDETFRARTFIPRPMIVSVTHYTLTRTRAKRPLKERPHEHRPDAV